MSETAKVEVLAGIRKGEGDKVIVQVQPLIVFEQDAEKVKSAAGLDKARESIAKMLAKSASDFEIEMLPAIDVTTGHN